MSFYCSFLKSAFYRSQEGLSFFRKLRKKSLKRGSWGLSAPGPKKLEKESKITSFQEFFSGFWPVLDSFSTFFKFF